MNKIKIIAAYPVWHILLVVYQAEASEERQVKALLRNGGADAYLEKHLGQEVSIEDMNKAGSGIVWVEERPFYEKGAMLNVHLNKETLQQRTRWCGHNSLTCEKLLYPVSCFLCNPTHQKIKIQWLRETLETGR